MPIYEFVCHDCGQSFEALVRKNRAARCPSCGGSDLERRMSLPAVQSETTHALAMKAARKRDQVQATDRVQAQIAYEKSHDDG